MSIRHTDIKRSSGIALKLRFFLLHILTIRDVKNEKFPMVFDFML